jgi:RHS repeat-associated protein
MRSTLPRASSLLLLCLLRTSNVAAAEKASEQVSKFQGSFSTNIVVQVPAFHGIEPAISLGYNSEGRNGGVGVGWGLAGFGIIERVNAGRGTPYFDANDTYMFNGQQLLPCVVGSTSPSCTTGGTHYTREESFLKISFVSATNKWTVRTKDGTKTEYSPLIQTTYGILRWGQTSVVDTKNNAVSYGWSCDSGSVPDSGTGDCYPGAVSYNGYSVTMYRETRPDALSWGAVSAMRTSNKRLKSIVVALGTSKIRGYKLSYSTSSATSRSLLTSVQMFGKDLTLDGSGTITGGTSLPAQTFSYQGDSAAHAFNGGWTAGSSGTSTENVVWTQATHMTIAQNDIQKTSWNEEDPYEWDGARATRSLNGDGYVDFLSYTDGFKFFGFDGPDSDWGVNSLEYAIISYDSSNVYAKAGGAWIGPFALGGPQWFRIEFSGSSLLFRTRPCVGWGCTGASTWTTFHTATVSPQWPQDLRVFISTPNAKYENAVISGHLVDATNWCPSHYLMFGDFNGDGRSDAACQDGAGGDGVRVTLSTGTAFGAQGQWLSSNYTDFSSGDFNGDGKSDLIRFDGWGTFYVATSTGSAFSSVTNWGFLNNCDTGTAEWGVAEFNGDGKSDVWCRNPSTGWLVAGISTGSAITGNVFSVNTSCTTALNRVGTLDFDGDRKDDLYCQGMETGGLFIYRGTGTGFDTTPIASIPNSFCGSNPGDYVWGDFNGDGKTDVSCRYGKIAFSAGRVFEIVQPSDGFWCGTGGTGSIQYFATDVDGDGTSEWVCNQNNGDAQGTVNTRVRKWSNGSLQAIETWKSNWCYASASGGDFTGDGKSDLYCSNLATAVAAGGTAALQADLLSSVGNGQGGTNSLTYVNSSTFGGTVGAGSKWALSTLTTNDGRGNSATRFFEYDSPKMDHIEGRFLGFGHARERKACVAGESVCPYVDIWFRQDVESAGSVEKIENRDGLGRILTAQFFEYLVSSVTSNNPSKSLLVGSYSDRYDGQSTAACPTFPCANGKRSYVEQQHDNYGNITQLQNHGDIDFAGDETTKVTVFVPNTSTYIVDRPAHSQLFAGIGTGGVKLEETRIHYDGGSYTQSPSVGNPTQNDRWLKSPTENRFISNYPSYDPYGNVTSIVDATGRGTTIEWDTTYHVFPVSGTNAASETSTTGWDPICGIPAWRKSSQQQSTSYQTSYQTDALCRVVQTTQPLGGVETRTYLNWGDPTAQLIRIETPAGGGTGNHYVNTYYDGLGRPYRTVSRGAASGADIEQETAFNARGLKASMSLPFLTGETRYVNTFSYDGWDRQTRKQLPDGMAIQTSYGLDSTTVTDEMGMTTVTSKTDPFQTVVERMMGTEAIPTISTSDVRGRLVAVTDALGHQYSWQYDSLDRNTERTDPDAGTWTFTYDDAGRLATQIDAKSQTTSFAYEAAGRQEAATNTAGAVTNTYSEPRSGFFNKGLLTTISTPTSVLKLDYDAEGRNVKQTRTLDGTDYVVTYGYDAGGFLKNITYPDNDTVGPIAYDAAGRVYSVPGLLTSVTYNATGKPLVQVNANGTQTTRTYMPERGVITQLQSTSGGSTLQSLQYMYEAAMIMEVSSTFPNESWTYTYDDLHRLKTASNVSNPGENQSWDYDHIGRITFNSRVGTYAYPAVGQPRPHGPTAAGSTNYAYDANGSRCAEGSSTCGSGSRTLSWDANNRLSQVTAGSSTTTFVYDAGGDLIKKTNGSSVSRYPVGDYEVTDNVITKYINAGALGRIAKRVTSGAVTSNYWLHADIQGSIQAVTTATPVTTALRRTYRPAGAQLSTTTGHTESRGWLGERHDAPSGLTYLGSRHYDPTLGIFVSVDAMHPAAPTNRYIYAANDPINMFNRTGMSCNTAGCNSQGCTGEGPATPQPTPTPGASPSPSPSPSPGPSPNPSPAPKPSPSASPSPAPRGGPGGDEPGDDQRRTRVDRAVNAGRRALENPDCNRLFGGLGPERLDTVVFQFVTMPDQSFVMGVPRGPDAPSNTVYVNRSRLDGLDTPGSAFVGGGETLIQTTTPQQQGALTVLHEFGHLTSDVSGFPSDASNPSLSYFNSLQVIWSCPGTGSVSTFPP